MFFARQETILQAIETVRKASFGRPPRFGKQGYTQKSEWVESCAKITGILNSVLNDVQKADLEPLVVRADGMIAFYKAKADSL